MAQVRAHAAVAGWEGACTRSCACVRAQQRIAHNTGPTGLHLPACLRHCCFGVWRVRGFNHSKENRICLSAFHEPYHYGRRPGKQQVFCSIREPVDHLLSEFNFRASAAMCNPPALQAWVAKKLNGSLERQKDRHKDDCHLLMSFDYAHSCDYRIPYDHKHEGVGLLMRVRFNITFKAGESVGGLNHQVGVQSGPPHWSTRA